MQKKKCTKYFFKYINPKRVFDYGGKQKIQKFLKVFNYNMDSILGIFGKEIDLNESLNNVMENIDIDKYVKIKKL